MSDTLHEFGIGTTFSHRQIKFLHLNVSAAFEELLSLRFDLIRLCCYWDELEPKPGKYDFSTMEKFLQRCQAEHQKVVLTIGIKAPRWPEFYTPAWVTAANQTDEVLSYLKQVVTILGQYACVIAWQVENEPLDPSGRSNAAIPREVLANEIACVRSLDPRRQIIVTVWGNELTKRNILPKVAELADIVGLDLYGKVPTGKNQYQGPLDSSETIASVVKAHGKPLWITELQAEPWESNKLVSAVNNPPSMNETLLLQNYANARELQPDCIFFWGYEYWYWRKQLGDRRLWDTILGIRNS